MRRILLLLTAATIIAALMATSANAQITPEDDQEIVWLCQDVYGNWGPCSA
jgi:hypothetical protein